MSGIQESATVWLFREFMNGLLHAAINARIILSSNDANSRQDTIKTSTRVVRHLLTRYDADTVIARADEEIRNVKQVSFTPW